VLDDRDVVLAAAQTTVRVVGLDLVDVDLEPGRGLGQLDEHGSDDAAGHGLERADGHPSADVRPDGRDLLAGLDELGLDAFGSLGEHEPDGCQRHAAGAAVQHLDTFFCLELGDLLGDRRGGQVQQVGGCHHSSSPVDRQEYTKSSRVQSHVAMLHGVWRMIRLCYSIWSLMIGGITSWSAAGGSAGPHPPTARHQEFVMSAAAQILLTLAGWTGAISAVVAYGLVTMKRISPDSLLFQGLNIVGAGLLSVSASVHSAWPSAVVNVIWVAIGVYAVRALWNARRTAAAVVVPDDASELTGSAPAETATDLSVDSSPEEVLATGWEAPASSVADHDLLMDSLFAGTDVVDPASHLVSERNSATRTPVAA
jgi:hypothetical protein